MQLRTITHRLEYVTSYFFLPRCSDTTGSVPGSNPLQNDEAMNYVKALHISSLVLQETLLQTRDAELHSIEEAKASLEQQLAQLSTEVKASLHSALAISGHTVETKFERRRGQSESCSFFPRLHFG